MQYIVGAIPVFVVSYVVSFVWSCAYEMPTMKLEKMFVAAVFSPPPRHREAPTNKVTNEKDAVPRQAWTGNNEKANITEIAVGKEKEINGDLEKNQVRLRQSALPARPLESVEQQPVKIPNHNFGNDEDDENVSAKL